MSHFSTDDWFDFARGIVALEQMVQMQKHLEEGCDPCLKVFKTWKTALEINRREFAYAPPAEIVQSVKAAYVSESVGKRLPQLARFAHLLFDSALQSAPAATRSSSVESARQLLYEAAPFMIDLRVESEPVRNRTRVTGQILNTVSPESTIENIEVALLKGEWLTANTAANSSGEFHLEFGEGDNFQLFLSVPEHQAIGIALPSWKV